MNRDEVKEKLAHIANDLLLIYWDESWREGFTFDEMLDQKEKIFQAKENVKTLLFGMQDIERKVRKELKKNGKR